MRYRQIDIIVVSIFIISFTIFSYSPAFGSNYDVKIAAGSSVPGCEVYSNCFIPYTVTINSGDQVTWYNSDSAAHTVTSGTSADGPDGNFDSSLFMAGTTFSVKFDNYSPGTYPYTCMVHPWMNGVVVIKSVSSYSKPSTPSYTPSKTDVVIASGSSVPGCDETNSCYSPYKIRVGRGSTVTWFNADSAAHTVTSGTGSGGPDGEFDSSLFMAGATFSHRFDREGTYPYLCMVHPWMTGYVIVERGGTVSPSLVPIPTQRDTTPPKILKPTDILVDAEDQNGARVTYDVLAIDDIDKLVQPSCTPSSGSFFKVGKTTVSCSARDSSGNRAQQVSFTVTVSPREIVIPDWIKNVAAFWCDDKIDDASFVDGIQYLIDNNIIVVSVTQSGYGTSQAIPSWIKNNACWWSQGAIGDADFAAGLEYLISEGIIRV